MWSTTVGVAVDAAMMMFETAEWLVVLVCSRGFMIVVCMVKCWGLVAGLEFGLSLTNGEIQR